MTPELIEAKTWWESLDDPNKYLAAIIACIETDNTIDTVTDDEILTIYNRQ